MAPSKLSAKGKVVIPALVAIIVAVITYGWNWIPGSSKTDSVVAGRVEDAASHSPLRNARVSIPGDSEFGSTDQNGQFWFGALGTGKQPVNVHVDMEGYESANITITPPNKNLTIALKSNASSNSGSQPPIIQSTAYPAGYIPPEHAKEFINESKTVCGIVVGVSLSQQTGHTFLNFGGSYPDHVFSIVIWKDANGAIPAIRDNDKICGTGKITKYQDKPEIQVRNSSQLQLIRH